MGKSREDDDAVEKLIVECDDAVMLTLPGEFSTGPMLPLAVFLADARYSARWLCIIDWRKDSGVSPTTPGSNSECRFEFQYFSSVVRSPLHIQ